MGNNLGIPWDFGEEWGISPGTGGWELFPGIWGQIWGQFPVGGWE